MDQGNQQPLFCQSCLSPLRSPEDFGTNGDGRKNEDYCVLCYDNGAFLRPELTLEDMVNLRSPMMVNMIIDPGAGRDLLKQWLSGLKRWQPK